MMYASLLARASIAVGLLGATPQAEAEGGQPCAARAEVVRKLEERFGETLRSVGLHQGDGVVDAGRGVDVLAALGAVRVRGESDGVDDAGDGLGGLGHAVVPLDWAHDRTPVSQRLTLLHRPPSCPFPRSRGKAGIGHAPKARVW